MDFISSSLLNYEENVKLDLLKKTMKGDWGGVVQLYTDESEFVPAATINNLGDTALHFAVVNGEEDIVEQLVKTISNYPEPQAIEALSIQNKDGNTPLHLAASRGSLSMCESIAKADASLWGARNNKGESPLFLAALYGRTDVFLHFHQNFSGGLDKSCYRRNDGDNILHCAINREYFVLARQIILLEKDISYSVNEKGITPLHLLANKPSAFKSGSNLVWWQLIIYYGIYVDLDDPKLNQPKTYKDKTNPYFPENYQACINFFRLLRHVLQAGFQARSKAWAHKLLLGIYRSCIEIVIFVYTGISVTLGLGSSEIRKMKETHMLSAWIMDKLILSQPDYLENGTNYPRFPLAIETLNPEKNSKEGNYLPDYLENGTSYTPQFPYEDEALYHDDKNSKEDETLDHDDTSSKSDETLDRDDRRRKEGEFSIMDSPEVPSLIK